MFVKFVTILLLVSQASCDEVEQCNKGYFSSCMLNEVRNHQKTGKIIVKIEKLYLKIRATTTKYTRVISLLFMATLKLISKMIIQSLTVLHLKRHEAAHIRVVPLFSSSVYIE